jgi:D-3-phosphoglycerate dehydrogenase
MGTELRGKTLGIVGLGRIGQEVARRASAFGMRVVAYDPYIARHVAAELHVDLVSLDQLCDAADYISLHVPATATTDRFFDGGRLGRCKTGVRIINTARGDLIDETALAEAIERGIVGGAALDVFHDEPPKDWRLMSLPQVIATPHIAASTYEAQELVGTETVEAVRDFLRDGIIRNAVNFPAISPEELKRVQPFMKLAERLGTLVAQMGEARVEKITVRYYGELAQVTNTNVLANSVLVGALSPILSSRVSLVNAREEATARGIEIVESRSTRPRNFTRLLSVKMITDTGERWVEGTLFEHGSLRLVSINGVEVEAPLDGTMLVIENNDLPGVIGDVGGILGRHQINIATFALGRRVSGAVGVVNLDVDGAGDRRQESAGDPLTRAVDEIRRVPAVTNAWLIQIG